MSGRVPPSHRAGRSRSGARPARTIYERFPGMPADPPEVVRVPPWPTELAVIGHVDAIEYTTIRESRLEKYRHRFRKVDRPLMCVSPDKRRLFLVDDTGGFQFTDRGIVDDSDEANQPD